MRVFTWTPRLHPAFETPVVATWCKLPGSQLLPVHLYDHSVLFKIGSLIGKPLQIDHATAHKHRMSFAHIYIEIDLTSTAPDEILLDIDGFVFKQRVIYEKLPKHCVDCKHVGHSVDVCYANGKNPRPSWREQKNSTFAGKQQRGKVVVKETNQTKTQDTTSAGKRNTTSYVDDSIRRIRESQGYLNTSQANDKVLKGNDFSDGIQRVLSRRAPNEGGLSRATIHQGKHKPPGSSRTNNGAALLLYNPTDVGCTSNGFDDHTVDMPTSDLLYKQIGKIPIPCNRFEMIACDDAMDTTQVLEETCAADDLLDMDDDGPPYAAPSLVLHGSPSSRDSQSVEIEHTPAPTGGILS